MAIKPLTIYNDLPHEGDYLADEIKQVLMDYFFTRKSDALEEYNDDEIAKYKIKIVVEVDH